MSHLRDVVPGIHAGEPRGSRAGLYWPFGSRPFVSDDLDPDELLALLEDEYARAIIHHTRDGPMSASELSETCDISISTVYRRAERLVECDLLVERQVPRPDGHHYRVFEATVDELRVRFTDSGLDVKISARPSGDLADRFTDMWGRL